MLQQENLNAPITLEELHNTISHLLTAKSPDSDGYTSEFFKLLKEDLTEPLLETYNAMWNCTPYFPTGKEAYIKLLPKKDKDPLEPVSYRPISLMNVAAKILSKIIANRLICVMGNMGFHSRIMSFLAAQYIILGPVLIPPIHYQIPLFFIKAPDRDVHFPLSFLMMQ